MLSYSPHFPVNAPADVPFRSSACASLPIKAMLGITSPNCKSEQMSHLHDRLIGMGIAQQDQNLDSSRYVFKRIGRQDADLQQAVSDIVNYSYNLRYLHDQLDFEDVAYETTKKSEVFTIRQDFAGSSLVLITARVVLDKKLDCYELFTWFTLLCPRISKGTWTNPGSVWWPYLMRFQIPPRCTTTCTESLRGIGSQG